jgi:hypothetical protein
MDVPGIQAEDLYIQLENDMLTVRGERRRPGESLEGCTARIERLPAMPPGAAACPHASRVTSERLPHG